MNEEIKQQAEALDITPAELGLDAGRLPGQIPELDEREAAALIPAVEQSIVGPANSFPITPGTPDLLAKAFRTIPQKKVNEYKALWDSFINKDTPFIEFACEMFMITSPILMQRDLENITLLKRVGLN